MGSSFEDPQQYGLKFHATLDAHTPVQSVGVRHRDRSTVRTLQVQGGVGHRTKDAACHIRLTSMLRTVGAYTVSAASTQRHEVETEAFADGTLLAKRQVLALRSPTVLENVELCITKHHVLCFFFNPFSPSPRHLISD